MFDKLKRYEFRGEYDMIHLAEVTTGEYSPDSYDIEWVRADEAAAALSEAQATIARLEFTARQFGRCAGFTDEEITTILAKPDTALSPREGDG